MKEIVTSKDTNSTSFYNLPAVCSTKVISIDNDLIKFKVFEVVFREA
jgi:hypothetical protein